MSDNIAVKYWKNTRALGTNMINEVKMKERKSHLQNFFALIKLVCYYQTEVANTYDANKSWWKSWYDYYQLEIFLRR